MARDAIPLVTDPNPIPTSKPTLLVKLITKAGFLVDVLSDIFAAVLRQFEQSGPRPLQTVEERRARVASIDGVTGQFTIDDTRFDFIDADIHAEFEKSLLNEISFFDRGRAFGIATVTSIIDPPEFGRVTIALRQVEVSSVPEPMRLALLISGGLVLIAGAWCRRSRSTLGARPPAVPSAPGAAGVRVGEVTSR